MREIKISVRNLIEFVLRSGDLDNRVLSSARAVEGTRAHQIIQKSRDEEHYQSEVVLKHLVEKDDLKITIEGRADGIIEEGERLIVEEIKTTTRSLAEIDDDNQLHWAQVKCYAYFLALEKNLKSVGIQLTYYQLEEEELKIFTRENTFEELAGFFTELLELYFYWAELAGNWLEERNKSITKLDFPYDNYRPGQRKLAVAVYRTLEEGKNLFVTAPTGIGKTISVIYPALKVLAEDKGEKIFYLTAKTIARQVAEKAVQDMRDRGLKLKTVTLTAKEKICFMEETCCNPEYCQYACGHFDRVNDVLKDLLNNHDYYNRSLIKRYAREYQVCPFELSLDLTNWSDCIICDYNYFFDPVVALIRFFNVDYQDYLILVDEAHNLVDRSRKMYSVTLSLNSILELKEYIQNIWENGLFAHGNNLLNFILKYLTEICDLVKGMMIDSSNVVLEEKPEEIYFLLRGITDRMEKYLTGRVMESDEDSRLLEEYFNYLKFLKIADFYGDNYRTIYQEIDDDITISLYCLDPSIILQKLLKTIRGTVFFSATLNPLSYYQELLGGVVDGYLLELPSPFPVKNRCLLIYNNLSTRYRDRENSYQELADIIERAVSIYPGNYLVFFPSYQYMEEVIVCCNNLTNFNFIKQERDMKESMRENFLNNFHAAEKNVIGFAVMGGIFSEGIDLVGEKLSGTIIVGPGHPGLSLERNLIREYYQQKNGRGYEFAYLNPGMNRVMQAAGRTIRSENDRGFIILIGQRFTSYSYKRLMPLNWNNARIVTSKEDVVKELSIFWKNE